ncbi:MAG: S8 family serine peptidase [Armatimonadetes bacterium]|nr:S8 family serine peptidase [Armatimonadota bacterium]
MASPIQSKFFTPTDLRVIREAVTGEESRPIFKAAAEAAPDGLKDVIILAPGTDDIFKSVDADGLAKDLQEKGVKEVESLEDVGVSARADQKTLETLAQDGYLIYDDSPRSLLPGIPRTIRASGSDRWEMPKIDFVDMTGADKLQEAGFTGKGQVVAVIDSGFQHPGHDLLAWKDMVEGSTEPLDPVGHGTHVSHDVLQMAPEAQIVGVRVMGEGGTGRPSDIVRGLQWVTEQRRSGALDIEVINMSLGGAPDGFPDKLDPINRAVEAATRAGITVVAAAGNSGPDAHTIGAPADAKSALAVGAAFNQTTVSDFSSRGPTDDGLAKPDVMAPGEFISAWSVPGSEMEQTGQVVETLRRMSGEQLKELLAEKPQLVEALGLPEDILSRSASEVEELVKPNLPPVFLPQEGMIAAPGTSFASPIVAGLVADLEQARDASPAELKEILRETADSMGSFSPTEQGKGFVNGEKALQELQRRA